MVPDGHSSYSAFLWCEVLGCLFSAFHHSLLCSGIRLAASIVRRPQPPNDSKEDGPGSGEDMVGEEQVGKIKCLFGILLVEARVGTC